MVRQVHAHQSWSHRTDGLAASWTVSLTTVALRLLKLTRIHLLCRKVRIHLVAAAEAARAHPASAAPPTAA
eukprot:10853583-Alexandrium_andersonii.AAC.1